MADHAQGARPRVLVLGAGFGGVGAARALADSDVDVVVVDKNEYHTFQPLLYQLATDRLEPEVVGHPLDDLFAGQENVVVHRASVAGIDLDRREVRFDEIEPLGYDFLVLALGATVEFFGTKGAAEHAFPMYTLADALRLREHVLGRWSAAARDPALLADGALDVVVVGGGPTGVECAGALAELYGGNLARDYPALAEPRPRISLVDPHPALFSMFRERLRAYAREALEKRGVEVRLEEKVAAVAPTRVTLSSGEVLESHTLVWGAGLTASPLLAGTGLALQRGGRVAVRPDLSVVDRPEVFAVGDLAWIPDAKHARGGDAPPAPLPQLGSVAIQAGRHAGKSIERRLHGKAPKSFSYLDKGTMATIGRGDAVVQLPRGRTLQGRKAALAWVSVHLALLPAREDRRQAIADWGRVDVKHERPGSADGVAAAER